MGHFVMCPAQANDKVVSFSPQFRYLVGEEQIWKVISCLPQAAGCCSKFFLTETLSTLSRGKVSRVPWKGRGFQGSKVSKAQKLQELQASKVATSWDRVSRLQGSTVRPKLQGSRTPRFQDSKFAFFLTLPVQEIETQQNRCWEIPASTLLTMSPISSCANTLDHWNATYMKHSARILPKFGEKMFRICLRSHWAEHQRDDKGMTS